MLARKILAHCQSKMSKTCLTCLSIFSACFCWLMVWVGQPAYEYESYAAERWDRALCDVNKIYMDERDSHDSYVVLWGVHAKPFDNNLSPFYALAERYPSYTRHHSDVCQFRTMSYQMAMSVAEKYDINSTYKCYYNPDNLSNVSMRAPLGTWIQLWYWSFACCGIMSALVIVAGSIGRKKQKRIVSAQGYHPGDLEDGEVMIVFEGLPDATELPEGLTAKKISYDVT